ncbi:MAG: response regulator [Methylococcales bacterium]|nr:response regulator [Methylococcales bacterium]
MNDKVKILVVDDSITYRQILLTVTDTITDAECIGTAASGQIALRIIAALQPDLVLLDVVMPDMDGVETLQRIKQDYPTVEAIMISGFNMDNAKQTVRSLQIGALDFIAKPIASNAEQSINELVNYLQPFIHLIQTKKYASLSRAGIAPRPIHPIAIPIKETQKGLPSVPYKGKDDLCVIGISTGGPKALDQ